MDAVVVLSDGEELGNEPNDPENGAVVDENDENEDVDTVDEDENDNETNNQSLKRKHSVENDTESSKKQLNVSNNDDDEGQLCPICFDSWTTSGKHRLCSLRCGHLFGAECVKRWLNTQYPYRCPTCNTKAKKTDIRYIYARKLISVDNSEMVRLNEILEQEKEARRRAELDTASVRLLYQQVTDDCQRLQAQIEELKRCGVTPMAMHQSGSGSASTSMSKAMSFDDKTQLFTLERRLNICEVSKLFSKFTLVTLFC